MNERRSAPKLDAEGPAAPPRSNGELVFAEPWESRVFGMTVALHERGLLDWDRFRERLIAEIGEWERSHAPGDEYCYYARWQAALERLLDDDDLCANAELERRTRELAARPPGHDHPPRSGSLSAGRGSRRA